MDYAELTRILSKNRQLLIPQTLRAQDQGILCLALRLLGNESKLPIELIIDCDGGSLRVASFIEDAIRFCDAPVHGIVTGAAFSAAFHILQACDRRLAYPKSTLMFHSSRINNLPVNHPDFDEICQSSKVKNEKYYSLFASLSNQPITTIREWSRLEKEFTAQEALELNFIDEILVPPNKK